MRKKTITQTLCAAAVSAALASCASSKQSVTLHDLQAKPGTIDLSRLGSTMMMCPDMTVERNVLAALGEVKQYRSLGNGQMALCGKSKKPIVVLQKRK